MDDYHWVSTVLELRQLAPVVPGGMARLSVAPESGCSELRGAFVLSFHRTLQHGDDLPGPSLREVRIKDAGQFPTLLPQPV